MRRKRFTVEQIILIWTDPGPKQSFTMSMKRSPVQLNSSVP